MVPTTTSDAGWPPGWVRRLALLLLVSAYLQGAITKLLDVPAGIAEMRHFGLEPALPFAMLTIGFELAASVMVLSGALRWLGALGLGSFTIVATFVANRFWDAAPPDRILIANAFFEHWGLAGAFLLVAWHDLRARHER